MRKQMLTSAQGVFRRFIHPNGKSRKRAMQLVAASPSENARTADILYMSNQVSQVFSNGECVLLTESRCKGPSCLVQLSEDGETKLRTRNGKNFQIQHRNLIGMEDNGGIFYLKAVPFRIKRPTLEEYVLHMRRGATPSYPKDIQAMLLMMDVGFGGQFLEAGTGSGALTLFLSRAAAHEGHIHSFDSNKKHFGIGMENFNNWCKSWKLSRNVNWPSNVTFYNHNVLECGDRLPKHVKLNGAVLDMQFPEECLECLLPVIKPGGPVVIFLPSVTQVVDVIRYCSEKSLPFHVESMVEVTHRMWKVLPVLPVSTNNNSGHDDAGSIGHDELTEENINSADMADFDVKYTAKPSFQQWPHTGFILKLVYRNTGS